MADMQIAETILTHSIKSSYAIVKYFSENIRANKKFQWVYFHWLNLMLLILTIKTDETLSIYEVWENKATKMNEWIFFCSGKKSKQALPTSFWRESDNNLSHLSTWQINKFSLILSLLWLIGPTRSFISTRCDRWKRSRLGFWLSGQSFLENKGIQMKKCCLFLVN